MHTNPETLALLALGEPAGNHQERAHIAECAICSAEVSDLAHLADIGRATDSTDTMTAPGPEVWERIRAELGFTSHAAPALSQPDRGKTASNGSNVAHLASRSPRSEPAATAVPLGVPDAAGPAPAEGVRTPAGRRLLSLVLAAALALIAGVGIGLGLDRLQNREETVATAELAALPQWAGAGGEAKLLDDDGQRYLVVNVSNPRPVSGPPQVWVRSETVATEMINLGPFVNGQRIRIDNAVDLRRFPLVDISDEPDANPLHSGNTIVQGRLTA